MDIESTRLITTTNFGLNRHIAKFWEPENFLYLGTNTTQESFFNTVCNKIEDGSAIEKEGYAPFCRNIVVKNDFVANVPATIMEITPENEHLLRTDYQRRGGKNELDFLVRYFPMSLLKEHGVELKQIPYFCLEFYSREHLIEEDKMEYLKNHSNQMPEEEEKALKKKCHYAFDDPKDIPDWVCINIKMQLDDSEPVPMAPQTIIVNALGPEYGGSGFALSRKAYDKSVAFFKKYAFVNLKEKPKEKPKQDL